MFQGFRLCLVLVVAVTAYSCRTDQFPEQETFNNISKFQLTSKRISLNEAKHKAKLVTELDKVETKLKNFSKSNAQGKVIHYGNGVSIDTDQVTYIENGPNFHTYTFSITRENALSTDPVENLVLIPATDGTYREMLISYNLTPQEKQLILDGEDVDTKGKTTVTILDGNIYNPLNAKSGAQSCVWVQGTSYTWCSEGYHNSGEGGDICKADVKSQAIKEFFLKCTSISDGTDTGGGWWAGEGGGTDNGGGPQEPGTGTTEPCNGNGVATNPVDPNTNIGVGGCEGIPTVVTLPPKIITSCQRLNNLWDPAKANAKPLIESTMYEGAGKEKGESGINFKREQDGTITYETVPHTDSTATNITTGGKHYLAIHSHPKKAYPMFSWSDIYAAYKLIIKTESYNRQHSALLLVAEDASGTKLTYAITFETLGKTIEQRLADPANLYCTHEEIMEKMDKNLERLYNEEQDKTNPNYERVFLQYNFGTNIGLYKANSSLTNWTKLSIDSDSDTAIIIPNNCN